MQVYASTQRGPLRTSGYIDPDDTTLITVFWGAPLFAVDTVYREGDICRPSTDNGYYYLCTTNGKSGSTEPATWAQTTQTSGTAEFEAVPFDLWVLPDEQLQTDGIIPASSWSVTDSVTLSGEDNNTVITSVLVSAVPSTVSDFELTNQVRKSNGEILSRTFRFKVNEQ